MQREHKKGHVVPDAFVGEVMRHTAIDNANCYTMVESSESSIANEPATCPYILIHLLLSYQSSYWCK